MSPLFLLMSFFIIAIILRQKLTLLRLHNGIWAVSLTLYFLGPLSFNTIASSHEWLLFLIFWLLCFNAGYLVVAFSLTNYCIHGRKTGSQFFDFSKNIGSLGAVAWACGGFIYSLPYITQLDFHSLRTAFVFGEHEVSILSKVGSVLSAFILFSFTKTYYFNSRLSKLEILAFFSLLLIPIFMAGRQLYLQILILIVVSKIMRGYLDEKNRKQISVLTSIFQDKLSLLLVIVAVSATAIMTLLRHGGVDLILYESRLDLYKGISFVDLSGDYEYIYAVTPDALRDIFIEFTYYFSAQIAKFSEFYSLYPVALLDFGFLEKSLFIKNNLSKILSSLGYENFFPSRALAEYIGYMPASAWGTVAQSNVFLFGIFGSCIIQIIFGCICSVSQSLMSNKLHSFAAFNFFVANSIVIIYSIMESALNEIYILIYYIVSMFLVLLSLKISRRRPISPPLLRTI